jgi:DNA polymerase-3 subunit alpha
VATAKDSDLYVTQFDNSVVETAGLLKMDFGFENPYPKDTVKLVKVKRNRPEPRRIPIDDVKHTSFSTRRNGDFQYESAGMQKYMKELKPTVFPI